MLQVAETLTMVSNEMSCRTDFKLMNMSPADNPDITHEYLNTGIDEPENRWNIHLVVYDILTS